MTCGDLAALALGFDRGAALLTEVDDACQLDAGSFEVGSCLEAAIVDGQDDGPLAGLDREPVDEAAHRVRQHHADEVVAREDERLLDDPARHDHPVSAELEQEVAVRDGHETLLEQPDRDRRCKQLDTRREGLAAQLGSGLDPRAVGKEGAADVVALVDHDDRLTAPSSSGRGLEAGLAPADHDHVDVTILDVDPFLARAVRIERAEARRSAQDLLVQRPELAGADERLVVEAGGRERAAELVGHLHQVALERAEVVLALDDRTLPQRRRADAHAGDAVDRHLAVGAVPGAALEAARAVVLEAAREDALPRCVERGADRVALESLGRLAVEGKEDRLRAVDPLACLWVEPAHAAGSGCHVFSTSFV